MSSIQYSTLLGMARGLKSDDGENPEYDRALIELCNEALGGTQDDVDETAARLGITILKPTEVPVANDLVAELRADAAQLRTWAAEARGGGWSTQQVDPMRQRADGIDTFLARLAYQRRLP